MHFKSITDCNLKDKIVFIRSDMNVPIQDGKITDNTRIIAALDTIRYALAKGAKVIVATHLGRPVIKKYHEAKDADSVQIIADELAKLLNQSVPVIVDIRQKIDFSQSDIVMLENVRCNYGEVENDRALGEQYGKLCDIFIHDAFATAHRKEASTDAIAYATKEVCAGLLMQRELSALTKALHNPSKPIVAIVGGAKISTKLAILEHLADIVDYLIVGGGILNTFLSAQGINVGNSLVEVSLQSQAQTIMHKMAVRNACVPLPQTVVTATSYSKDSIAVNKDVTKLNDDDMILDISSQFAQELGKIIASAKTIIWNGPMGAFELAQFASGTKSVATSVAENQGFSLAGGGDTIAALNQFKLIDKISYVSTAGGALLEFLEGKELPALKLLTYT